MLRSFLTWLCYTPYDRDGKLKILHGRAPDCGSFSGVPVPGEIVDMVLTAICESFDIDLSQKYCLRPGDNLGDIYRAMTKCRCMDDLEYERLHWQIAEWIGPFESRELGADIDFTVEHTIRFVAARLRDKQGGSPRTSTCACDLRPLVKTP